MNLSKTFLKILWKKKPSILLFMAVFLVMSYMLVASGNNPSDSFGINTRYSMGIVNRAQDDETMAELEVYLEDVFKVVEVKDDDSVLREGIIADMYDYVLVIDENRQLSSYSKEANASAIAANMRIQEFLNAKELVDKVGVEIPSDEFISTLTENVEVHFLGGSKEEADRIAKMETFYNFGAYTLLGMIISSIFIGYKNFKDQGISDRIMVSGTPRSKMELDLFLSSMVVVFIIWMTFAITSILYFRELIFTQKGLLMLLNSFVFCIPVTAIAFLVSSLINNDTALNASSNVIAMVLSFISGIFVPIEFIAPFLIRISTIFPAYWYVKGNRLIATSYIDYDNLFRSYGVMILMGVGLVCLTLILAKTKEKNQLRTQ